MTIIELIDKAVEDYRIQLEQVKILLETEFGGTVCGSLQDEMCGIAPYIRIEGCKDYPSFAVVEITSCPLEPQAVIRASKCIGDDLEECDISRNLEWWLQITRASALELVYIMEKTFEVVES
jgi:hypothetical protein